MISSQNYPEETTIKLNPKNPAIIVAGANLNNYYNLGADTFVIIITALIRGVHGIGVNLHRTMVFGATQSSKLIQREISSSFIFPIHHQAIGSTA